MSEEFSDISITGVDDEKTLENKYTGELYRIHLTLSSTPTLAWSQLFDEEWSREKHSMWRDASVSGRYITIICSIDEIDREHKEPLKKALAMVNALYRMQLGRNRLEREGQQAQQEEARKKLGKIKF